MNARNNLPATVLQKLNPFATIRGMAARGADFFNGEVRDFYRKVVCAVEGDGVPMLLSGIFLLLMRISEANTGQKLLAMTPVAVKAGPMGIRALDKRSDDRPRRVFVWVDAATTLPGDFELRWSLDQNAPGGLLQLGMMNELGMVPPLMSVYLHGKTAAPGTVAQVYIVEES